MATHAYVKSNDAHSERARLYQAALKGDWKSVKDMPNIQREINKKRETTLHIAAAANQENFVKNLVNVTSSDDLKAVNIVGNTALTYAAATGNVNIAKVMLDKNQDLEKLCSGVRPLIFMAAVLRHSQMVQFLYSWRKVSQWCGNEQDELFITCVKADLYGVALDMLKVNPNFATAKNEDGEIALHVLAHNPSAFVSGSQLGLLRRHLDIPWLKLKRENSKQSQAHELFNLCLHANVVDIENINEIPEISQVLFVAAEVGNVEFLVKLIRFDFDLLWKIDNERSIFHIAVEQRHESIFNLLIGSIRDIIVDGINEDGNNILHLAAELAPQEKLNAISGAALQMQRELLWFKEVEKIVKPSYKEMKNEKGETPYVLFAMEHEDLRKEGEKWMMNTAKSSMVVATLISSIMFSGLPTDGLSHNSKKYNLELAYSVSSATALFCSSTSLIMFLCILTSRYSYDDFLVSLPIKLMTGVTSLFISIAAMMVAFSASFCLINHDYQGFPFIAVLFGLFAFVPILYVFLKYRQFVDIIQSTCCQFQPRQRLL